MKIASDVNVAHVAPDLSFTDYRFMSLTQLQFPLAPAKQCREVEGQPALALLTFSLPGAVLRSVRLAQGTLEQCRGPEAAMALGGTYGVRTIVSQGCTPIGEPWTITGATGNVIETIAQRPAYEVLLETVQALPREVQQRARGNLFVGLAMDEYREALHRGDFLIRNVLSADAESGTLTVGAIPRPGQTLQFQLRDRVAADEDLRELLEAAKADLGGQEPIGALLCSCNGRGIGLFGTPDHDVRAVADRLGPIPLAGFFCNGEVGPVGSRNFLRGYTASIALVVRK